MHAYLANAKRAGLATTGAPPGMLLVPHPETTVPLG